MFVMVARLPQRLKFAFFSSLYAGPGPFGAGCSIRKVFQKLLILPFEANSASTFFRFVLIVPASDVVQRTDAVVIITCTFEELAHNTSEWSPYFKLGLQVPIFSDLLLHSSLDSSQQSSRHCWNLFCPHVESRRQDKERLFPEWTDLGQCRISLGHENLPRLAYFFSSRSSNNIHTQWCAWILRLLLDRAGVGPAFCLPAFGLWAGFFGGPR